MTRWKKFKWIYGHKIFKLKKKVVLFIPYNIKVVKIKYETLKESCSNDDYKVKLSSKINQLKWEYFEE